MGRGKSQKTLELIAAAWEILNEIQPASVRAVCYQLFTLNLIASMSKNETNRVSTQLTWARENGIIPWEWIVDETRAPERVAAWEDPAEYIEVVKRSYRRDRWTDQPDSIEAHPTPRTPGSRATRRTGSRWWPTTRPRPPTCGRLSTSRSSGTSVSST